VRPGTGRQRTMIGNRHDELIRDGYKLAIGRFSGCPRSRQRRQSAAENHISNRQIPRLESNLTSAKSTPVPSLIAKISHIANQLVSHLEFRFLREFGTLAPFQWQRSRLAGRYACCGALSTFDRSREATRPRLRRRSRSECACRCSVRYGPACSPAESCPIPRQSHRRCRR
jgi:hypothetical protein